MTNFEGYHECDQLSRTIGFDYLNRFKVRLKGNNTTYPFFFSYGSDVNANSPFFKLMLILLF